MSCCECDDTPSGFYWETIEPDKIKDLLFYTDVKVTAKNQPNEEIKGALYEQDDDNIYVCMEWDEWDIPRDHIIKLEALLPLDDS